MDDLISTTPAEVTVKKYFGPIYTVFLLITNTLIFYILEIGRCSDGFCPTIVSPLFFLGFGILLTFRPFSFLGKLNKKQVMYVLLISSVLIFLVSILVDARWASTALKTPGVYPGFNRSGVPIHGIWFGFYQFEAYGFALGNLIVTGIGAFLGYGLLWLKNLVFKKLKR